MPLPETALAQRVTLASLQNRLKIQYTHEALKSHLEQEYGSKISSIASLDIGVFKIEWTHKDSWLARVHPSDRGEDNVRNDALVLQFLDKHQFPAEKCAHAKPVTVFNGQSVIVTKYVVGERARGGPKTLRRLGAMLGRLNKLTEIGDEIGDAGAWHHMSPSGGPKEDIYIARLLLAEAQSKAEEGEDQHYAFLKQQLDQINDFSSLPRALIHPDFVPSNVIVPTSGGLVAIDWSGAGRGARLIGLGFLLYVAGAREISYVDEVLKGYATRISLETEERKLLVEAIQFRPLIISCWELLVGRRNVESVVQKIVQSQELAEKIAARSLSVLNSM